MKGALLLLAVAAGAGCADTNNSISVIAMQEVTPPMCVANSGATMTSLSRGTLDVTRVTTQGYIAVPVIRNNLMSSTSTGSGMFEYNGVTLVGANVSLQTADGTPLPLPTGQNAFFYPSSGVRLDPGGTGAMFVEVLRADVAQSMAGMIPGNGVFTVIANIRPVGMKGDTQIVGENMPFPIDLCSGCLVGTVAPCPLPAGTMATDVCFPQQDVRSTCCSANGTLLCGSTAPVATM